MVDDKKIENSQGPSASVMAQSRHPDAPRFPTSTILFDGRNYLLWSRSMLLSIASGNCVGYLKGTKVQPEPSGSVEAEHWGSENSLVMAYLINHMTSGIARGYLFMSTAAEIWQAVKVCYSHAGNDAQIYDLRKQIQELKQHTMTVSEYFHELRVMWQELDVYDSYFEGFSADVITKLQAREDKLRTYAFLVGLNSDYDSLVQSILLRDPLPPLQQVFAIVQKEDSRRVLMPQLIQHDRSALATFPAYVPPDRAVNGADTERISVYLYPYPKLFLDIRIRIRIRTDV